MIQQAKNKCHLKYSTDKWREKKIPPNHYLNESMYKINKVHFTIQEEFNIDLNTILGTWKKIVIQK